MSNVEYTFTLEVRDTPGVLVRVAQVFARRGCNISALDVRPEIKGSQWSIMNIDAYDVPRPDQIRHQLEKLVDVHQVTVHHHAVKG